MGDYRHCMDCGADLFADDIAIHRKLILRNADKFFCIDCLGKHLGCTRQEIERLIKYYRESGQCTLFR